MFHATQNRGSTMLILCLGTVGLAAMEGARMAGTSRIMCVELNHAKYEKGTIFCYLQKEKQTHFERHVNPKDHTKPVEVLAEMTNSRVYRDVECTGHIEAMISAFEYVHDSYGVP